MLWIRLAVRDLMKNKGFAFFFVLNLSLGLAGFIAIHSFGKSLDRHLDENLKEILTADLVLSSGKPLTPAELSLADQVLGPDKASARIIQFYTMVKVGGNARLMQVMAMDNHYPLYGEFPLENHTNIQNIQEKPGLFMTRDTAYALGIKETGDMGTPLVMGNKTFFIEDFLTHDPDKSLTSVELAPNLYMGIEQLEGTGLIRFGSRIWYLNYYRFGRETDVPHLAEKLQRTFSSAFPGQPRFNIYDSRDVNQRLGRVTGYFTGYMGLISVVALFLAGIATAYLFRGYLDLKQKEIAILMSIGARQREIYVYISLQLMLLGGFASSLSVVISLFLIPAFPTIFQGLIPASIRLTTDPVTVMLAVGMGMAGSLVFCLPVFVRIFGIKPLMLLQGTGGTAGKTRRKFGVGMVSFLPGIAAFILVSVVVAGSFKNGMVFVGGFVLALAFICGMGWLIFAGCKTLSRTRYLVGKIAFRNLFRNKWSSLSCFVTIAMGAFLISIIPQVQKGIQNEIMRPEGLKVPIFFLVDIQDEQKGEFIRFMQEQDADLVNISPMVRGRILTVNQQPFHVKKTESESPESAAGSSDSARSGSRQRNRTRRLEFNFSHRTDLDASESIVQGVPLSLTPWNFESTRPFEISVEKSFAEYYGLTIGDIMGFEVQGIPLTGKVRNIRKVRWNSFQPNFYLLFQDGVLNDAPKTFLAAVSNVAPKNRQEMKNRIVNQFPNVSVIDVTRMAGTLLSITDKLSLSIRFMAWLAIAAGLVSIFSIARHEAWKNENQVNLLKVLGTGSNEIQAITLLEFGFIGFTASLFAILLSFGFSLAISWYFFDNLWQFDPVMSLLILVLTTTICMGTALTASRKVIKTKPVKLLANSR